MTVEALSVGLKRGNAQASVLRLGSGRPLPCLHHAIGQKGWAQLITDSEVTVIPKAGHLLMLEHSGAFAEAVSSFLKG